MVSYWFWHHLVSSGLSMIFNHCFKQISCYQEYLIFANHFQLDNSSHLSFMSGRVNLNIFRVLLRNPGNFLAIVGQVTNCYVLCTFIQYYQVKINWLALLQNTSLKYYLLKKLKKSISTDEVTRVHVYVHICIFLDVYMYIVY